MIDEQYLFEVEKDWLFFQAAANGDSEAARFLSTYYATVEVRKPASDGYENTPTLVGMADVFINKLGYVWNDKARQSWRRLYRAQLLRVSRVWSASKLYTADQRRKPREGRRDCAMLGGRVLPLPDGSNGADYSHAGRPCGKPRHQGCSACPQARQREPHCVYLRAVGAARDREGTSYIHPDRDSRRSRDSTKFDTVRQARHTDGQHAEIRPLEGHVPQNARGASSGSASNDRAGDARIQEVAQEQRPG
ncbi:unnamed protein product, partial [Ectocarpus fasciculatus]